MKLNSRSASKFSLLMGAFSSVLLIIGFSGSYAPFEVPLASAGSPYGIRGQMAPELNLSNWIDGHGQKTEPIRLGDYHGKVVYLYFFQDW